MASSISPRTASFRRSPLTALLLCALSLASPAGECAADAASQGAAREQSAWLAADVLAPEGALEPILITLSPSEKPCRKAHGDDWWERCSVELGRRGAVAEGVRLSPSVPGVWRWRDASTLAFEPREAWAPGKVFMASLLGVPLPLRAGIDRTVLTIETPPLAATSARGEVMIDPKVTGPRWLAFEFHFTTAPDRAKVEAAFRITPPAKSRLRTAAPAFLWSDDGASVYVKARITTLPRSRELVAASIAGVAARIDQRGGRFTVPKGFETVRVTQAVPGMTDLYRIAEASVSPVRDAGLNVEYELLLRGTLQTDPRETLRSLRLLALPAKLEDDAASDADWTKAPVIDEEVLSRAAPVEASVAPGAEGSTDRIRLRFSAPEGTYLYLELPEGFGPDKTPGLSEKWSAVIAAPRIASSIEFLQPGAMLTLSGARRLSVVSTGVERIRWRIARVRDDFLALASEGWNTLRTPSPDAWTEARTGELMLPAATPGRARFSSLDLAEALREGGPGLFQIELEGVATKRSEGRDVEEVVARAAKRLLVTNIALIAKISADASIDVFAAGFDRSGPVEGLRASLVAANGTVLESVLTDEEGRARFPSVKGLERERKPVAVVVRSEDPKSPDLAWLSLADGSNVSPVLRWSAGGRETGGGNIAGCAFADRGVVRAGETAHFGLTARMLDWTLLPEGIPLTARLTDDAGRVLESRPLALTPEGLASLDWAVPAGTAPGQIRLDVLATGSDAVIASTRILVAEDAPETLELSAALPEEASGPGWTFTSDADVAARLTSLFGGAAEGRTIEAKLSVTPLASVTFPELPGFTFPSPGSSESDESRGVPRSRRTDLGATLLDETGGAVVTLPLADYAGTLPGFALARVTLTGLERDGAEAVERTLALRISPAKTALGWRIAGTPQPARFLMTGEAAELEIAAVNRLLAPEPGVRLVAEIQRTRLVASVVEDASGRVSAEETPVAETVRTLEASTDANGRARISLETGAPGDWRVVVRRPGAESALEAPLLSVPYSTVGGTLAEVGRIASEAGELPAAQLRGTLEKKELAPGETARASLLSPMDGFALVTFESAGVLSSKWISVKAGENLIEAPVPEGFAGRAWLRVALVRGQGSAAKLLRGFSEWAAPVTIGTGEKTLALTLSVPEVTRASGSAPQKTDAQADGRAPESTAAESSEAPRTVAVPVTLSAAEPSRVFVWAVDEGLLNLTHYEKPDPVKAILEDRALEVSTRETLSELMPDAGSIDALASPFGGGFAAERALAANFSSAGAFRRGALPSALWWGGLIEIGPEPRTLEARVPEGWSGRLKFFAAGASADRAGSAEAAGIVREPLVIAPRLPATVAPGDRFRAGFTVTPEKPVAAGALDVRPPAGFLPASATLPLIFPKTGGAAASTEFAIPADASLGRAAFTVTAAAGDLRAERRAEVAVRPASVMTRVRSGGRIDSADPAGDLLELPVELHPQGARTEITVSPTPNGLLRALAEPFSRDAEEPGSEGLCASSADSVAEAIAAALPLTLELTRALESPSTALTGRDMTLLWKRQNRAVSAIQGALGPSGVRRLPWLPADEGLTAWSLEYLLAAARSPAGSELPPQLIGLVRDRLVRSLSTEPQSLDEARTTAYALWVLTREGTMTTEWLEALRATMEERFANWEKDAAAAFLAASYQTLRLKEEAARLVAETLSTARAGGDWTPERATALAAAALARSGLGGSEAARLLSTMAVEDFARTLAQGAAAPLDPLITGASASALDEISAASERAAKRSARKAANAEAEPEVESGEERRIELVCTKRAAGFDEGADKAEPSGGGVRLTAPGCLEARVTLSDAGSALWWESVQSGWLRAEGGDPPKALREGLEVERTFLDASGRPATTFRAGERVTVRVRVRASLGSLDDVTVTDLLPGGMTYALPAGAGPEGARRFLRGESSMTWLAGEVPSWGPTEFTYAVRATTPGDFAVAPIAAESASRPAIRARGDASRITILAEGESAPVRTEAKPDAKAGPAAAAPANGAAGK